MLDKTIESRRNARAGDRKENMCERGRACRSQSLSGTQKQQSCERADQRDQQFGNGERAGTHLHKAIHMELSSKLERHKNLSPRKLEAHSDVVVAEISNAAFCAVPVKVPFAPTTRGISRFRCIAGCFRGTIFPDHMHAQTHRLPIWWNQRTRNKKAIFYPYIRKKRNNIPIIK